MSENSGDFAAALAAFDSQQSVPQRSEPTVGEKIQGTILSIGEEVAFVDVGAKAEAILPVAEISDAEGALVAKVGDSVEALVSGRDESGALLLRTRPGRGDSLPEEIRAAHEHGLPVEGLVTGVNKGGAEVEIAGQAAFCPVSQLDLRYVEDASVFVGQRLTFRVTRYEGGGRGRRANIVLSRKAILADEAKKQAAETRAQLEVGAIVRGRVTSIASFGAFVDLGGIDGLLHVSQMGYQRIEDPADVVAMDQELEVQVLEIAPAEKGDGERISLSLRALAPDPWKSISTRFPVGSAAEGPITRLESFGGFVELEPGVEGLIHISELGASRRLNHAREMVALGDRARVKVLAVDEDARRISLSVGALQADATAAEEAEAIDAFERREGSSTGFGALGDFFSQAKRAED